MIWHIVRSIGVVESASNYEMKFPILVYIPISISSLQPVILTEILSSVFRIIYYLFEFIFFWMINYSALMILGAAKIDFHLFKVSTIMLLNFNISFTEMSLNGFLWLDSNKAFYFQIFI